MCHLFRPGLSLCLSLFLLASCASVLAKPVTSNTPDIGCEKSDRLETTIGEKAATIAETMVGKPYRYKGSSPSGFDCSGLVQYSYLAAGMEAVPHGTKALRDITVPTGATMQIGDLLFFNERGKTYSHVGIYLGGDAFVHAPGTGGRVRKDSLEDPYYKDHFVDARRFM
jgi:cell wall-associated NlpC family hydrolase